MLFKKTPEIKWSELPVNAKVIDVREPHEYKERHYKGAINIPLSTVDSADLNGTVYIVCQSGRRSKIATKALRKRKLDAYNIIGGMLEYDK